MRRLACVMLPAALLAQDPAAVARRELPPGSLLGSLEPAARIVANEVVDTDGDGCAELVLVTATGELQRHGLGEDGTRGLVPSGTLQLRDPSHSLFAFADIAGEAGHELIVADPLGTHWLPWPVADIAAAPRSLARRARFLLRTDTPQLSPFVQDLNRDGLLDLLIPTLQGCQPFVQHKPTADGAEPQFGALAPLPLPVQVDIDNEVRSLTGERQGGVVVPAVETADLDGDGRPDLLTRQGKRRSFQLQGADGVFGPPLEVDLEQFQDSTPKAAVVPGSTIVLGDQQHLQRGDIDGDGIPDFVIAHRRKVWTFLSTRAGPQFTKARTQAVADDVSALLLVDLDEDRRADLLTFRVQLPGIGTLLLAMVQSLDIDVKAVGYRSEAGRFANLPTWRRTVTLRIPSLLSLLNQQEELAQRFFAIVGKARRGLRGAFSTAGAHDLALVRSDGTAVELYAMASAPPALATAAGRRMLRTVLFEDPDPLFDLERLFKILSGFLDQHADRLIGNAEPTAKVALRAAASWRLSDLLAAPLGKDAREAVVVVYEANDDPQRRAYDVIVFPAAGRR